VQHRWSIKRRSTWALIAAPILALASLSIAAASNAAVSHGRAPAPAAERYVPSQYTVAPNPHGNMVDCNGWSANKNWQSVAPHMRGLCVDPHGIPGKVMGSANCPYGHIGTSGLGRFVDNCHYVGHDEPSVKFISKTAGSGYQMHYFMKLPTDPSAAPTNDGSVTHYAELTGAAWFGLPICDPASYGQRPCTPHSDANISKWNNPKVAGSAFMELQFYAPGFAPFQDDTSCSATKWCVAMTIDSLASQFGFVHLNLNCPEPVNFAYLQTNGVPAGPPSPQKTNGHTFTPNAHTLKLNSGDVLKVSISDPLTGTRAGFTTKVADLTTHQTGFMIASARNGFMHTNYKTCAGSKFTFHAEYNTARQRNQVPWAALEGGVLMEQEIGHNEVCSSLTNTDATNAPGLSDPTTADTCVDGNEGASTTGEGSCDTGTGICTNPTAQGVTGPTACPSNNFTSPNLCEYADGTCIPQGTRSVTLNGATVSENSPINFCQANRFQNGDLDYDGISYQTTSWPNGTGNTPTSFRYAGPFLSSGKPYPQIQFETDAPGSASLCDPSTGTGCVLPPISAAFYPYWTLTNKAGQGIGGLFPAHACIWNFGNTITGITTKTFGGDAQYGSADLGRPFGTNISSVKANPQISGGCPVLHHL
jgi:hypothetical protein